MEATALTIIVILAIVWAIVGLVWLAMFFDEHMW